MSHLSHSELTTMTGQIPSAVTPTTHLDVEKRVKVYTVAELDNYAFENDLVGADYAQLALLYQFEMEQLEDTKEAKSNRKAGMSQY